jgi:ABC-type Fe3+ transport system permease subunit
VGLNQIIFGAVLVAGLLFLAVFYGWRQVLELRRRRDDEEMSADEAVYRHRRAWRRLINSVLMLILAVLLSGLLIGFEERAEQLKKEREAVPPDQVQPLTPEQRSFSLVYGSLWIVVLLVLLVVVILAAVDALATRSYALRQFRKLAADRQAMIERQAMRLRRDRNGH